MSVVFVDRMEAGNKLAEESRQISDATKDVASNVIVLAIPRVGVIIGDTVASRIGATLDIVVSRKIGACFLNTSTVEALQVPEQHITTQVEEQMKEISRRLEAYRRHKQYDSKLEDKIVILVDDGIATDSTIFAAAQWIKAQKCRQHVIAVPVGPKDTIKKLEEVADIVVAINAPGSFQAVRQFYQDFSQVTDEEVKAIMHKHSYKPIGYRQSLAE